MARVQTWQLAAVGAAVAAGLAGSAVALGDHSADSQFLNDQLRPPTLRGPAVERVVRTAPDPFTGKGSGTAATCKKGGPGLLGNPWTCVVRYKGGKSVRLRIEVADDGTYAGRYVGYGRAGATGCCVELPGER